MLSLPHPAELKEIIKNLNVQEIIGSIDKKIDGYSFLPKKLSPKSLFITSKFRGKDFHQLLEYFPENAVTAILCEKKPQKILQNTTYVIVENIPKAITQLAKEFYNNPDKKIKHIGITGTNGKTSTTHFLFQLIRKLGLKAGMFSTVKHQIEDQTFNRKELAPPQFQIYGKLHLMQELGCSYSVQEVFSLALKEDRADHHYAGAIFTNITHDHLDYHHTFENYLNAKKKLFDQLSARAFAVVNSDDPHHQHIVKDTQAKVFTFSLQGKGDFNATILENSLKGLKLELFDHTITTNLIGKFNAYNLFAALCMLKVMGEDIDVLLKENLLLQPPSGRFERIDNPKGINVIVDYAHSPDSLENVLQTIHKMKKQHNKLITVIGCGGNRDISKRPVMASLATNYSNLAIFTSDNPRFENPEDIVQDMLKGVRKQNETKVKKELDRQKAISQAYHLAKPGDIVLIAGKGHEAYQEINGQKKYFSDHEVVKSIIENNE